MYAIIGELKVNWAKINFDDAVKVHIIFLPCESLLTHVFRAFKIPLNSQTDIIKIIGIFYHQTLI